MGTTSRPRRRGRQPSAGRAQLVECPTPDPSDPVFTGWNLRQAVSIQNDFCFGVNSGSDRLPKRPSNQTTNRGSVWTDLLTRENQSPVFGGESQIGRWSGWHVYAWHAFYVTIEDTSESTSYWYPTAWNGKRVISACRQLFSRLYPRR